ncbi:MAG: hypothetical protein R2707_05340 [Acidimicrobiales bacterium]
MSHTAAAVLRRPNSGNSTKVWPPSVMWAPLLNSWSSGMKVIWFGSASIETVAMKSQLRPLKSIHANPYAAKAAIAIGMTVAGITMASELTNDSGIDATPERSSNTST